MTLKNQISKIGYKLSDKCTILAIHSVTQDKYKITRVEDNKAMLIAIYGATNIEHIELSELYNNYHSLTENKNTTQLTNL